MQHRVSTPGGEEGAAPKGGTGREGKMARATRPRKRKNGLLVGFRIRTLRKERNLTQSELASRVGIQQSDLCRMETGEYKVSLETLFKVLTVFEMNIAEFFLEQAPDQPRTLEGEILDLLHHLDERERKEVKEFLLFKVNQREHRKAGTELPTKSTAGPGTGFGRD